MTEQDSLFSPEEIEILETPEAKQARIANAIFRRWYVDWYHDEEGNPRYTQQVSHIAKEFKTAILAGIDSYELEWAGRILGQDSYPINALNFQWSLARVRKAIASEAVANTANKNYQETL